MFCFSFDADKDLFNMSSFFLYSSIFPALSFFSFVRSALSLLIKSFCVFLSIELFWMVLKDLFKADVKSFSDFYKESIF